MKKSEIFTVSNILSLLRILLAIPIYILIAKSETEILLIVLVIAIITDYLDGYFARKFNQITDLGKILDPFADKVCTTAGFIALTVYQGFPLWITALIILRDVFILLGSLFIFKKEKFITPSNLPGKFTVFFISLLALVHILNWNDLFWPITILVILSIVVSAYNYFLVLLKNLKTKKNE
jgi:CDP-diacylglycerol--glycerol-3-phosphate 3-phosphatidyltransferase